MDFAVILGPMHPRQHCQRLMALNDPGFCNILEVLALAASSSDSYHAQQLNFIDEHFICCSLQIRRHCQRIREEPSSPFKQHWPKRMSVQCYHSQIFTIYQCFGGKHSAALMALFRCFQERAVSFAQLGLDCHHSACWPALMPQLLRRDSLQGTLCAWVQLSFFTAQTDAIPS